MSNNQIGRCAAFAMFGIGVIYAVALITGVAMNGLSQPIVDPLLAIMELLTLISAPLLLVMMAALHNRAQGDGATASSIALAFMILAVGTTCAVHFVELTALRQLGTAGLIWPSTAYALELLAWDMFLGLSLVFAAAAFRGAIKGQAMARGLMLSGCLCLFGLVGPATGNMRLQFIGVLGYAGVLPVVCLMVAQFFRADSARDPAVLV